MAKLIARLILGFALISINGHAQNIKEFNDLFGNKKVLTCKLEAQANSFVSSKEYVVFAPEVVLKFNNSIIHGKSIDVSVLNLPDASQKMESARSFNDYKDHGIIFKSPLLAYGFEFVLWKNPQKTNEFFLSVYDSDEHKTTQGPYEKQPCKLR